MAAAKKNVPPPSYSTFGLKNTTKLAGNPSGGDPLHDCLGGGTHKVDEQKRGFGRPGVREEVDPSTFLRKGTGAPACDAGPAIKEKLLYIGASGRGASGSPPRAATAPDAGTEGNAAGYGSGGYGGYGSGDGYGSGSGSPPGTFTRQNPVNSRAPVPKRTDRPMLGLKTDRNFVVSNAMEVIVQPAKKVQKEEDLPTQAKSFGKVPGYLSRNKAQIEQEKAALQAAQEMSMNAAGGGAGRGGRTRLMPEDERNELLDQLRKQWDLKNKQYQQLSFIIDTQSKLQRKEALEAELEKLEASISKLSKSKVYVYDDGSW